MRHNQNGRRFRGRNNDGGQRHHQGGGNHSHHHHNSGNSHGNPNRRVNPRVQTFDSNGPDVRIRGNAYQINEKYVTLARDANSAGDRILAESYLQHAEHYQRMINDMAEEYNKYNPPQFQQQQPITGEEPQPVIPEATTTSTVPNGAAEQPNLALNDLDQGFLRGPRNVPVDQADGNSQPRKREIENA
ncbi:MAG: DUF4167 domain-containing protein [Alphaproteobacteria bacterium]|nr:MAG: DUF4167 domain-containing protein [Alphaproteobacteria bacterium]